MIGRGARSFAWILALLVAAPALAQSAAEQLAAAAALFDAKRYADAAQRLEQFLGGDPPRDKVGIAAFTLGRCYTELGQFAKAVPAYERALASKDPAVAQVALLGLSEAAVQTGQWEKAAGALDAVVKTELKPEQAPILWYWRGQAKFQLKRYDEAEASYRKILQDYSSSDLVDGAWFGAGLAALRQSKTEVARQHFRTLIDRYPKSPDRPQALLLLAQIELEAKRYREAREGFTELLQGLTAETEALRRPAEEGLIQTLLEQQDFPAAAARLQQYLGRLPQNDPQRPRAQLALGNCLYRQKQYEPALAAYREAARATDETVAGEGQYWAANAALALERPADAAALFGELAQRFPKHPLAARAQLKAADSLLAAKKPGEAAQAYQRVVERFPEAAEAGEARKALANLAATLSEPAELEAVLKVLPPAERGRGTLRLARLHLKAKAYPQAEGVLTALLREKPEAAVAAEGSYLLGLACDAQEKRTAAIQALSEAVAGAKAAPWAADAQERLAWLYLEVKEPARAEATAQALLATKPADEIARQARLALLQALVDQQKWPAALETCRALLAGPVPAETAPTLLFTQAWVLEKLEKTDEALPVWEKLLAEHRKHPYAADAMIRLADARFKAEKYAEARDLYAALLAEFPKSPLVPEARFKYGSALYNLDRAAEAAAEWDRLAADSAAGEWGPEALYWAGVALDKAGKKAEAVQRLERLVARHPQHARVPNAKVRLAALKAVLEK